MDLKHVYHGRRVLITGGLGFIGSNLAARLVDDGAEVTIVDNLVAGTGALRWNIAPFEDRVSLHVVDLADSKVLEPIVQSQDFIFNLAGRCGHLDSMEDPQGDLHANLGAHLGLLDACRRARIEAPILFTSTRQVYGAASELPVHEGVAPRPIDVNGCHKLAAEHLHRVYGEAYGLHTVTLRLTATYGPRMFVRNAGNGFLGLWIRQVLEGAPVSIFGDGNQQREFNYVADVLDALLAVAVTADAMGGVYNLGAAEAVSLNHMAEALLKAHGDGSKSYEPFPKDSLRIDIGSFKSDYGQIQRLVGWYPRVSLDEGLRRTLQYYRKELPRYL